MKYTESSDNRKSAVNTGLYIIIGLCLLVIGGASWFALSASNNEAKPETSSSNKSEYSTPSTSYNDSVMDPPYISEPMQESVDDQPYSSETETVEEKKPEIVVFTMPVQGEVLKFHSDSQLQFSATYSDMRLHTGIDIAAKKGTAVSACGDGTVKSIELNTPLGNVIIIEHKNGITAKYASIDNIEVEVSAEVKAGDIIGTVSTVPAECADKEHLHLEVFKDGKAADPLKTLGLE